VTEGENKEMIKIWCKYEKKSYWKIIKKWMYKY